MSAEEAEIPNQEEESASSDRESDADVSCHTIRQQGPQHFLPNMFMPYIEGPHMDWTVNDGLYHRFLKWMLKCENILECKLAAIPEHPKCKKVVVWSGDFGMDQSVGVLEPAQGRPQLGHNGECFEEFCKPQVNEVRACFDLLTSFRQGTRSFDEWYNTVQAQINLAKYPLETAKILHRDYLLVFF